MNPQLIVLLYLLAPQNLTLDFPATLTNVSIVEGVPATPAITDTDCATDFADVLPTDNRFDDRPIADWGDLDDGCDPFPQNERPSVF